MPNDRVDLLSAGPGVELDIEFTEYVENLKSGRHHARAGVAGRLANEQGEFSRVAGYQTSCLALLKDARF